MFSQIVSPTNSKHVILLQQSIIKHLSTTTKATATAMQFSLLEVKRTKSKKEIPSNASLEFGKSFSDHQLEIDWNIESGWSAPIIKPFSDFLLSPSSSVFHYGLAAFEGMKAYHDKHDNIRLFRPQLNMQRLQSSCEALHFPSIDETQFLECIKQLLRVEKRWIPSEMGYSLYIRPTIISTTPQIKVLPAQDVKLFVVTCPVGPYYKAGFNAVSLLATEKHIRAWPGGCGAYKLGSNYGPTIKPQADAEKDGYEQICWLFPKNNTLYIGEVGSMNLFFYWINEAGDKELITAPLDGTILPGVTRDSVLKLSKYWNKFQVVEREFTMDEVLKAIQEERILECFGTGTAAIISPVKNIGFGGVDYAIPLDPNDKTAKVGPLASELFNHILKIQYGEIGSPLNEEQWSVVV